MFTPEQLQEAIKQMAEDAYKRGFEAGREAVSKQVYAAVAAAAPVASVVGPQRAFATGEVLPTDTASKGIAKRAPKGLTEQILLRVFDHGFALPLEEVQRRAMEMDGRISAKTVYNELYRRPQYLKDERGYWRLYRGGGSGQAVARNLLLETPQERDSAEAPIG